MLLQAKQEEISVRVLGAGANVLIRDDGFDGVIVRLDQPAFRDVRLKENESDVEVEVGGGADLMPFARECSERGWSGLEGMAGIPASVGGAVRMNAGGRNGEFGDVVKEVRVVRRDGRQETWSRNQIGFAYRRSNIGDATVVSATLKLRKDDPEKVRLRFEDCFDQKLKTQPIAERSAGCIFKNPAGHSAGALIDQAGLKGTTLGHAQVSKRHANFIVAQRGARSEEVIRLIDLVRDRVYRFCGTLLEMEIEVW